MAITGLTILLIASIWVLKENGGEFIIADSTVDWFVGVIVANIFIFTAIWIVFVDFYNKPEAFGYEKIVAEEIAESEP